MVPEAASGTDLPLPLVGALEPFERSRLRLPAPQAAIALLGALLVRKWPRDGDATVARIVETEAYREDDPASHSHRGRTARTEPMFGRPGTTYVYRSYGLHWCINVAVERDGVGAAVLLRAATVLRGVDEVRARRPGVAGHALLRGPGNLTAGLDLDALRHDGGDLVEGVAGLTLASDGWEPTPGEVRSGPRVGVRLAPDLPWRFHLRGVSAVSSYRRSPRAAGS